MISSLRIARSQSKKVYRKVQEEPQAEAAANTRLRLRLRFIQELRSVNTHILPINEV